MNEFTTDSMQLATVLALYGYIPAIKMVSERKASFIFDSSEELEELVKRYGLSAPDGLVVPPRELFDQWTSMRLRVSEAQKK